VSITFERRYEAFKAIHDAIRSGLLSAPEGKKITKLSFWEDANGNIKYIKAYDGAELLFTLEFSNAGASAAETWNITRS
jgi:hypothetical protein